MAHGCFCYVNHVDTAAVTSASEALPGGAAANLKDFRLSRLWRSEDTTAAARFDFGGSVAHDVLGLFGANLGPTDTIRFRLSAAAPGGSELLDATVSGIAAGYGQYVHLLPATIAARYLEIHIVAPAAATAAQGYFEVGRALAGPLFRPLKNFAFDNADRFIDLSKVQRGETSGVRDVQVGALLRQRRFAYDKSTEADRWGFTEMVRQVRLSGQLLFIPNPLSAYLQREAILGGLDQLDWISNSFPLRYSTAFSITEDK